MSYTPTTEEVREVYRGCLVQTETNIYSFVDEAQADAEFDRWLAEVKREAKEEAWTEGYIGGFTVAITPDASTLDNPYRHGEEQ